MRFSIVSAALAASFMLAGCDTTNNNRGYDSRWGSYDYDRPDPKYNGYHADRYYREGKKERRLSNNDRIYRGQDGRYYCRRSDGTTGLVVGALAGGVLGNIIAPGGSETLGTILGAGVGGLAGRSIDRGGKSKCR